MRSRLLLVALALLCSAQSACSDAYGGVFPWAKRPTGVATNPTNLVLDATAHGSGTGGELMADSTHTPATAWQTVTTPTFSTGAGPNFFLAGIGCDGSANPYAGSPSVTNTSGLTWTLRKDEKSTAGDYGSRMYSAFSSAGSLTSQTVVFHANTNNQNQNCTMNVWVIDGVPASEASTLGATGGFIDNSGASNITINATVNAAEAKDWIVTVCADANGNAAFPADSNTTPWDNHNERTSDSYAFGRYRLSGAVQATAGSGNVTIGSTTADKFCSCAAIAVKST